MDCSLPPLSMGFSSLQLLSCVWFFATPWIVARQASLSITNTQSSLKLSSIESVMPSNHLILCHPLLLLPLIPPSIRVFSNESTLCMRWPKYWSFSFSISPSNEYSEQIFFKIDWLDLLAVQRTLKPTDIKAETLVLWPLDVKSWLICKDPDSGKDWRQEEKGMTEDEMAGWHHRLNGAEFE